MPFLSTWHIGIGDPNPIGWIVTIGYLLTAAACSWQAVSANSDHPVNGVGLNPWWMLAIFLVALGINKQLDLQTLLIQLGRTAAQSEHWYQDRRIVQKLFVILLTLATSFVAWRLLRHYHDFASHHWGLMVGLGFVVSYCLLRAAEIDHLVFARGAETITERWLWALELLGVSLMLAGALSRQPVEAAKSSL